MGDVFDEHARNYSEEIDKTLVKYGAKHDFFTEHKAWLIARLLGDRGRDSLRMDLLDVGCGIGAIHPYIEADFRSITGVDTSSESIDVARSMNPGHAYHVYNGERLPFESQSFDLTMAICVFHHIPTAQWATVAGEMMRILRSGGLALVIEHNPFNPVTQRIVRTCELDKDAVLLRPGATRDLFRKADARAITTRTVLSVPPVSPWLRSMDMMCGRLPLGAQYFMIAEKGSTVRDTVAPA